MKGIVYSPKYNVNIGVHVFPTNKYDLIREELIGRYNFSEKDFVEPERADDSIVMLAHTNEYVEKVRDGRLTVAEQAR